MKTTSPADIRHGAVEVVVAVVVAEEEEEEEEEATAGPSPA
jgi:hypothetical protein